MILFILSIASITLFDFTGSGSFSIFLRTEGTTCHETPNLSLTQPHWLFPPPTESFSQSSSTSCCVSQFMKRDIPSENLKYGPPLKTRNSCPSISVSYTHLTLPTKRIV